MKYTLWALAAVTFFVSQSSFAVDLQNGLNNNGAAKCCTSGTCLNLPACTSQNGSDIKLGKGTIHIPGTEGTSDKGVRATENQ